MVEYKHFGGPCFHFQGDDRGSRVLRNVGILPHHYTASQPRRPRLVNDNDYIVVDSLSRPWSHTSSVWVHDQIQVVMVRRLLTVQLPLPPRGIRQGSDMYRSSKRAQHSGKADN
jgi:hypothetical protein